MIEHIAELRKAVRSTRQKQPFHIGAWMVLPDHMHAIWTLLSSDDRYSDRWRAIKKAFTKAIPKTGLAPKLEANATSMGFGKGDIGSIPLLMKPITRLIWIIFISSGQT